MKKNHKGKIVIPRKKKIALVCSGGAAKAGAYHLGVALALKEKGFHFLGGVEGDENSAKRRVDMQDKEGREISIYVGSSAGAIISSFLAAGYKLDTIFESFLKNKNTNKTTEQILKPMTYKLLFSLRRDTGLVNTLSSFAEDIHSFGVKKLLRGLAHDSYLNLFQMKWLKLPGFFSTSGIEKYMREDVLPSNQFSNYKADLFLVATQLNHSRKVVFGKYKEIPTTEDKNCIYMNHVTVSQAAAASTALPPVFAPYAIEGENGKKVFYFDGEIRDTLSTHVAVDAGADLIFASYIHQPYHFSREIGSVHEYGIPMVLIQTLYLIIERKIQQYRQFHDRSRATYDAINEFFEKHGLPEEAKEKCLKIFEQKMNFKSNVDYVHIHPRAHDHEMFFGDHFNLNPDVLKSMVRIGFKNAIDTLRKYEFE